VYVKHRDDTSGTITSSEEWRTMLIGGQRAGGRSLYMLDITDPTDFNTANAKELVEWEFTHADMGYTFSKPTIAMMNNGKFAAIFGNGYSDETDSSCTAKLFIVYLDGGQDGTWTAGTDYLVIDTGAGTTTDGDCNGLSTPAVVDLNRDRTADRVYAGDLQGNLWAFDLCNYDDTTGVEACTSSGWAIANSSPIMTANDGASPTANPQPITVQPVVSRDPASAGGDDLLIVFGTGQYLTNADKTDTSVQTMYGVRDYDALANGRANNDYGLDPRANADKFIEQDMVEQTCPEPNCTGLVRTIDTPEETMSGPDNGWLIDLPTSGERVVSNPKIRNNILFFNTLIPDNTVCSAGGSGWLMSVNLQNGGIPPKEVFDINNDGVIDVADRVNDDPPVGVKLQAIPAESTFLGDKQYTPDSTGTINVRDVNIGKSQREGRMGWREMLVE
jgi:type IV pilus assembly protein PilY1